MSNFQSAEEIVESYIPSTIRMRLGNVETGQGKAHVVNNSVIAKYEEGAFVDGSIDSVDILLLEGNSFPRIFSYAHYNGVPRWIITTLNRLENWMAIDDDEALFIANAAKKQACEKSEDTNTFVCSYNSFTLLSGLGDRSSLDEDNLLSFENFLPELKLALEFAIPQLKVMGCSMSDILRMVHALPVEAHNLPVSPKSRYDPYASHFGD